MTFYMVCTLKTYDMVYLSDVYVFHRGINTLSSQNHHLYSTRLDKNCTIYGISANSSSETRSRGFCLCPNLDELNAAENIAAFPRPPGRCKNLLILPPMKILDVCIIRPVGPAGFECSSPENLPAPATILRLVALCRGSSCSFVNSSVGGSGIVESSTCTILISCWGGRWMVSTCNSLQLPPPSVF